MTTKSQFRRPNFKDFVNGRPKVRRTGQHDTANMSSIDPYYEDDDRTVPRLGSIQFPGAEEDTDRDEDDEHEDLWKTNPLGSGLNETQESILDDGDDINDVKEIEVVDLTGKEEEDAEPPSLKRPREEGSDLS